MKAFCVRRNGDRGQSDAHELQSLGLRQRVLDLRGSERLVLQLQLQLLLRVKMRKLDVGTGRIRDDAEHKLELMARSNAPTSSVRWTTHSRIRCWWRTNDSSLS